MKKALFLSLFFAVAMLFAQEWDFRDGNLNAFRAENFQSYDLVPEKGFVGVGKVNAYFLTPWPLDLPAADFKFLEIGLISDETRLPVYFSRTDKQMDESTRYDAPLHRDNHRVLIDLTKNPEWRGTITNVRFDVSLADGHKCNIRYIRFLAEEPVYADTGILPNGDFSAYGENWSGDVTYSSRGALIAPNGTLHSAPVEMPVVGKYLWLLNGDESLETTLEYLDILGNSIGKEPATMEQMASLRPPRLAASIRLHIHNTSDSPALLERALFDIVYGDLSLTEAKALLAEGKSLSSAPGITNSFLGNWIWLKSLGEELNTAAVFQKTFRINDLADIAQAKIHITADNEWSAYLNGKPITASNYNNWNYSDSINLMPMLKEGKNTLLVRVFNEDGPGGVLADIVLKSKDARYSVFSTDNSWTASPVDPENRNWKNARPSQPITILIPNGAQPWGPRCHGEPSTLSAKLLGFEMPETFDENTTWAPKMSLLPQGEGTQNDDLDFSIRFKNDKYNFLVLETLVPGGTLEAKDPFDLNLAPANFQYFPEGTYDVVIRLNDVPLEAPKGLKVTVKRTPAATLGIPTARIVDKESVPQIELNGTERATLTHYLIDQGEADHHYREMKLAFDNGVPAEWLHHIVEFDENGDPDFTNIDNQCTSVLTRDPQVQLVLITALDCVRNTTMTKFFQENPDTLVETADGRHEVRNYSDNYQKSPSMASEKWLAEGDRILTLLIQHLNAMPYGRRVAGILPSSGITWEWMYWGSQREGEFVDYSVAFRQAFVRFAQEKYGTIEKANQAWNKSFASFDEIVEKNLLPTPDERMDEGSDLSLRLPAQSQYVMDYNRCLAVVTSDAIKHFCHTVKTASQGKLLAGAYYGYYNQIAHSRWAQNCGHWALSRVLACPDVDFLHAPTTYNERQPGAPGGFMIPDSSAHLAGKVFVTESDIRTSHSGQMAFGGCKNLSETAGVYFREAAACLTHNVGMRYYDFSNGWTFRDPRYGQMANAIAKAQQTVLEAKPLIDDPANAIATVISENAMETTTYKGRQNIFGVINQYSQLPRSGIAFDNYLTPGLENIPLAHKLWFFECPYSLSEKDFQYIQEKILVPGNTVIFAMGADVVQQDHFSTEHMELLTEMTFQIHEKYDLKNWPTLTQEGQEILGNPADITIGLHDPFAPLFIPQEDNGTQILARDPNGTPVMAQRMVNGCRVIFCATPFLKGTWLRAIAQQTGLHCYNETDGDVTWASGDVIGIHSVSEGTRTVHTLHPNGTALDLIHGTEYPLINGTFQYDAQALSTALFLIKQ